MEAIANDAFVSIENAPAVAREYRSSSERWLQEVQSYPPIDGNPAIAALYAQTMLDSKRQCAAIEAKRQGFVRPLRQLLAATNELFGPPIENLEEIERLLKGHIATYEVQIKAAAEAHQRELTAQADAERERLQAEADAIRAAASAELDAAVALELTQKAAQVSEAASMVPIEIAPEPAKLPGVTVAYRWVFRVISKRTMIEFFSTHPEYDDLVEFKQAGLDSMARALKSKLRIPGGEAVQVPSVAGRIK